MRMPQLSTIGGSLGAIALAIFACLPAIAAGGEIRDIETVESFVGNYCLDCHQGDDASGALDLESLDFQALQQPSAAWDCTTWEKMVKRLRARQMPPVDATRPDEDEYTATLSIVERLLSRAAHEHPRPGRTESLRRLTRTEYRNAVRDLLDLEVDVDDLLPHDESAHGFDNVTVGELSPTLLDRYITAAQRISRVAVGRTPSGPQGVNIRLPADQSQETHVAGLPFGTRGGTLFRHNFVQSGEYEVQVRLARDRDEHVEGLHRSHDIHVLLDRSLVHEFTVKPPRGGDHTKVDAHLIARIQVTAGPHDVGVTFPQVSAALPETKRQPFDASFNRHRHPRRSPAIFEVSITGPFSPTGPEDTPSRRRIFTCLPATSDEERECGQRIFTSLLRRAYRRPVTEADLEVPMRLFDQSAANEGFEAGIEAGLAAILVNPYFLFRIETDPVDVQSGAAYQISDIELASRLSFFLWSSLPDDELLRLAEQAKLHDSQVLHSQVARMLKDERSESLATNFADQWLHLRNLESFQPDMRLYPDFDDNLRQAFRQETQLLVESVVREDMSVLRLIDADYTFANERLAKHYGIPGVSGSHFRKVPISPDSKRGGVLRHGSVLAVTSYATRTSPTIRGNWILENILGMPPPPPPPNVPALEEKPTAAARSVRDRLAVHRANPACATCHDLIDPLGFALESYDAVGRWREYENEQPVDCSGAMPDGLRINGASDLEAGILKRPELYVEALVEKLLTYALGRGIEPTDGPAIRRIVQQAAEDEYRFSSLVAEIVASPPFQMRESK